MVISILLIFTSIKTIKWLTCKDTNNKFIFKFIKQFLVTKKKSSCTEGKKVKSQSLYPCSHSHLLVRTYFLLTFEKFSMHLYTYTHNTFVLPKWDHTVLQPPLPHLIDFGLLSISACIPLSFTSCTESHCMCGPLFS